MEDKQPLRILFIGNSLFFYNQEVPFLLEKLCPGLVEVETSYFGGAKLEDHWRFDTAHIKIRKKKWDYVVLQESSWLPSVDPDLFYEYVEKFDVEIKEHGAETLLFMTSPYHASLWLPEGDDEFAIEKMKNMTDANVEAYKTAGEKINAAAVIPSGLAAVTYMGFDGTSIPDMDLYHEDKTHPSPRGTLLSTLTTAVSLGLEIDKTALEEQLPPGDPMLDVIREVVESNRAFMIDKEGIR